MKLQHEILRSLIAFVTLCTLGAAVSLLFFYLIGAIDINITVHKAPQVELIER